MKMGFRRYVAPSAREALERIRKELGPEAVILSNRRSAPGRVEIIAAAPGQMRALVEEIAPPTPMPARPPVRDPQREPVAPVAASGASERLRPAAPTKVAPESFQEFIRRQATHPTPRIDPLALYSAVADDPEPPAPLGARPIAAEPAASAGAPAVFRRRPSRLLPAAPDTSFERRKPGGAVPVEADPAVAGDAPATHVARKPAVAPIAASANAVPAAQAAVPVAPVVAPVVAPTVAATATPDARVMEELRSLRSALSDRITNLEAQLVPKASVADATNARPDTSATRRQVMTRLLMSGFSPELARRVGDAAPASLDPKECDAWLQQAVGQQIRCPGEAENPLLVPGAVALVGPTGVGKTTTIAKLAARFVVRHGAGALGLVTLDSYRIGAHEQLRGYGRILGVPVQSAHDVPSLRDLLRSLHGKRKVLIDTCGMSQRDPRLGEMLAMLDEARFTDQPIQRVLLINAASHAETLDEVARAWRVPSAHGAVMTKIDEAARIGGALDAVLRYRVPLLGLTNGQRVPEDWHAGNPGLLAHIALKPLGAAFSLDGAEIQALTGKGAALV
jgi:flagellar biosynthesis protein FlhF